MQNVVLAHNTCVELCGNGWLRPNSIISHAPSPNFNSRPDGCEIDLLVIHNISLPPKVFTGSAIIDFFQNKLDITSHPWFENIRDLKVSAHFLIRRDGSIVQFVSTLDRAWHAGESNFNGRHQCNDFSIGIELEGTDCQAFATQQYSSLKLLSLAINQQHPLQAVWGHEHIAPGRKTDPGPYFDWARYASDTGWPKTLFPPLSNSSLHA